MISNQNALEHIQVDINPESNDNYDDTRPHIVENSNLDLESYSNNYTGLGRLYRLAFIADHCPSLRVEALKLAIGYVKKTYNVGLYQTLHNKLVEATTGSTCALPNIGDNGRGAGHEIPQLDQTWIEMRTKKAGLQAEKLDTDLKNYKSNSIKESIRRGYQDLGDHYLDCGDLNKAFKSYCGVRDSCTSGKHAVNMFLNVIKVSLYLQNWAHVTSYVCKVEQTDFAEDKDHDPVIFTRLRCAAGIAELACKRYKSAARHFLQASLDHCDFPEILSPSNVAVYGGLCALATYDRKELQKDVIFSSSFKLFLELEPQFREIIFKFYESKYATCLRLLEEIKDSLYLDMYIAPHVTTLYSQIRNRALVQYFSPYLSTDMRKMAAAFNTSVPSLEDELIQLILDGQIQARIDSHNRILYAKDIDRRSTTFKKALSMGQQYSKSSHMLVLRAAVVKHHIQVKD